MTSLADALEPFCGPLSVVIARFLGPVCLFADYECNGPAKFTCRRCNQPFCARHKSRSTCSACRYHKYREGGLDWLVCGGCAPRDETPCGVLECQQWAPICTTHVALASCVKGTWYCLSHTSLQCGRVCGLCGARYDEHHLPPDGCPGKTCVAVHDCRPRKRARNPNAR